MLPIPADPIILLSFVNTQLRDFYPNLTEFCKAYDIPKEQLIAQLKQIDYTYDSHTNRFV